MKNAGVQIVQFGETSGEDLVSGLRYAYLVTYDIRDGESEDYTELQKTLSQYEACNHCLKSVWIIATYQRPSAVRLTLSNIAQKIQFVVVSLPKNIGLYWNFDSQEMSQSCSEWLSARWPHAEIKTPHFVVSSNTISEIAKRLKQS